MPNWCGNLIEVYGPEDVMTAFKEKAGNGKTLFNNLYRYPNGKWDYDWCIEHWGTKWDVDAEIVSDKPTHIVYRFDTAWAPPEELFRKVSEDYPDLYFHGVYAEPGMDFTGEFEFGPYPDGKWDIDVPWIEGTASSMMYNAINSWSPS